MGSEGHDSWCDGSGSSAGSACCRLAAQPAAYVHGSWCVQSGTGDNNDPFIHDETCHRDDTPPEAAQPAAGEPSQPAAGEPSQPAAGEGLREALTKIAEWQTHGPLRERDADAMVALARAALQPASEGEG